MKKLTLTNFTFTFQINHAAKKLALTNLSQMCVDVINSGMQATQMLDLTGADIKTEEIRPIKQTHFKQQTNKQTHPKQKQMPQSRGMVDVSFFVFFQITVSPNVKLIASIHPSIRQSVRPSIHSSIHPSIHTFTHPSIH